MATNREESSVSFLVIGKTGVGKSSLINSLAGFEVAEEGEELEAATFSLESYEATNKTTGNTIRLWDTPGLFDLTHKSGNYMEKIRDKCKECDLFLYCTDMTDTRITQQDKDTVQAFTHSLGLSFWQRSCFIFTFANEVSNPRARRTTQEYFETKFQLLKGAYCSVLKNAGLSEVVIDKIPFVPAGYHPWSHDKEMYILPDGKNWISSFWLTCMLRYRQTQMIPRTEPPSRDQLESRSTTRRNNPNRQVNPTRNQCTFNAHKRDYIKQDWFECYTCWGGKSQFGCCWPCALDCHKGHQIVKHHRAGEGLFFCDCGLNKHQQAVCTFYSTKGEYRNQLFYRCFSCLRGKQQGVCHQCMINCHRDHHVEYTGELSAFCDCGSHCHIPEPR